MASRSASAARRTVVCTRASLRTRRTAVYGPGVSTGTEISTVEKWLIGILWFHAALSVLWIVLAWRDGIVEDADLRFVVNTTAKDGLFAVLSVIAALNARRRLDIVLLLIAAYAFLIVGQLFELALADPPKVMTLPADAEATTYLLGWMAGDVFFIVLFFVLYRAVKSRR